MSATRYRIEKNGKSVVGVVQGNGGVLAGIHGLKRLHASADHGRILGLYEPLPGHVRVFPSYSAEGNGPHVDVDLLGASVTIVSAS